MITNSNPYGAGSDEYFMYRALQLARRGLGWISPNPQVGCVIVRDGRIISEGWHRKLGEVHAEVDAISRAADCSGAEAFISLEPCSHVGKQPSCTSALIEAGISRVVYAFDDPDRRSCGKARSILEQAGISVESGLLADEAQLQLDYFSHINRDSLCFCCLKLAISMDGMIACGNGSSQWLSGEQSLGYAHFLRQKYDAILVGSGTVERDDPRLTTRPEVLASYLTDSSEFRLRNMVRVVLDRDFNLLASLHEYRISKLDGPFREELPKLIFVGNRDKLPDTSPEDVELIGLDIREDGYIRYAELFRELRRIGISSLLVEGGASVAASLLEQDAADTIALVATPVLVGSDGLSFSPRLSLEALADARRYRLLDTARIAEDVLLLYGRK